MTSSPSSPRFHVVIAGGGVAALEAGLALRELAGDRPAITLLAPEPEFVYRPLAVLEPFSAGSARHYELERYARDIDAELLPDHLAWLDPAASVLHTAGGDELGYDALLLALGARRAPEFRHAHTLDARHLDDYFHGLVQDVELGYINSLAFLCHTPLSWPLPLYELALMTARRADDMGIDLPVTLVTSEDAPLALFGPAASEAVSELLAGNRVTVITGARCTVPGHGRVWLHPRERVLSAERVVALPRLSGPAVRGLPGPAPSGFIPVDAQCRVAGLERVFAAGDATDFPVRHGGIAAQHADVAAQSIAALAGAPVVPARFAPEIHGVLLGGDRPLYLSARVTGGHGSRSRVTTVPGSAPAAKIAARRLAPYLRSLDEATAAARR